MAKQLTVYFLISLLLSFWGTRLHATETLFKNACPIWIAQLPRRQRSLGRKNSYRPKQKSSSNSGIYLPLEYDEQTVTSFLLVPYLALASMSLPRPLTRPFTRYTNPDTRWTPWQPVWVEGKIYTTRVEGELATASIRSTPRK